ncbi:MAG: hypothetical protein E7620_00375 [Ruminococcaceae bacterium]|nr:hypothetical protein [Oscillospiraceae bacterium]
MITYGLVKEIYVLNHYIRVSYGIVACANAAEEGSATIVASARDLTTDRTRMTELVALCNSLRLDPVHLREVAEDFLQRPILKG